MAMMVLALSVLAQTEKKEAPAKETPEQLAARAEWKRARDLLSRHTSVQARLVETVNILNRSFKAEGRYLQGNIGANDQRLRLELTLKIARSQGSILEICDGDVLWSRYDIGDKENKKERKEPMITRRNVTQILDAARRKGENADNKLVADLSRGGLPALLASLERFMEFHSVKSGTFRDRPVNVVHGTWAANFLAMMKDKSQPENSGLLPSFVPDRVEVFLDTQTGFPLRIEYFKRQGTGDVFRPQLTLDFLDVVLDQPLDKSEFVFIPPDRQQPVEVTPSYLSQLVPPDVPAAPGPGVPK